MHLVMSVIENGAHGFFKINIWRRDCIQYHRFYRIGSLRFWRRYLTQKVSNMIVIVCSNDKKGDLMN